MSEVRPSPTDEVRRLLDERGVDYQMHDGGNRACFYFDYNERCGDFLKSIDVVDECIIASQSYLTPEQAITATVGVGTCKDLGGTGADGEDVFNCSECGCVLSLYDGEGVNTLCTSFIHDYPRFCPECGKRII